jgi:hypothetical protein
MIDCMKPSYKLTANIFIRVGKPIVVRISGSVHHIDSLLLCRLRRTDLFFEGELERVLRLLLLRFNILMVICLVLQLHFVIGLLHEVHHPFFTSTVRRTHILNLVHV